MASAEDASRERFARRLLRAKTSREARTIARTHAARIDDGVILLLARRVHAEIQRDPSRAAVLAERLRGAVAAAPSPLREAHALVAASLIERARGRPLRAVAAMRRAVAGFRRAKDLGAAGDASRVLVELEKEAGHETAARAAFRSAMRAYERAGIADPGRLGKAWMNLGNACHHFDRHAEALECYAKARRLLQRAGDPVRLASCDYNRANILATLDRIHEARSLYESALDTFSSHGLHALVAQAEYAGAGLDVLEGRLDAGLDRLRAVRGRHAALGDASGVAHVQLDAADALLRLNLPHDAEAAASEARAFFARSRQPAEVATADALLAGAALQKGRPGRAVALFRRSATSRRALGNRIAAAQSDIGVAMARIATARPGDAEACALAAARTLSRAGLVSRAARALSVAAEAALQRHGVGRARRHASRAMLMARRRDTRVHLAALLTLARCEERSGAPERAHELLVRGADLVDRLRLGVTSEESLLAFALDKSEVFEALVANRLRKGTPAAVREALAYAERGKSRALAERLARGRSAMPPTPATRAALERLRDVERRLAVAEARLEAPGSPGLRMRRETATMELVAERARALSALSRQDARQGFMAGAMPVDPWEGVATLRPGEIVLEYAQAEGDLHLFVVDAGRVEAFPRIAPVAEVRDLVDMLRFQLGRGAIGPAGVSAHEAFTETSARRRLADLHARLLGPLGHRLDGRVVRVVPHGVLHGVPFHALERDGSPLVERAIVSTAPSLAVLGVLARTATPSRSPALVLGVPDQSAPEIEAEVAAVERHVAGARVFRGAEATTTALRLSEDRPNVLHVACHGVYSEGSSVAGALRLGDTWMSLPELHALRGTGTLVVLSGCATGRGTVHSGDEWVGLVRGFLLAGARCVVASLWEVHDKSTAELMDDFYSRLAGGAPVGEALALSQRAARARGASLLHWAPFIAVGDPALRLDLRRAA